ncbi:hypothetical protein DI53_1775 [Sphingobacterium deserti]|uniref:Uncharacterized protein n=1 Tax=Sphingobacterium deserti TaxID=1229276 RepID=A0A0B8T1W6_9SPHI|nr:hypothetical protein DI53_1775 [Sphingobacterium deserti]
MLIGRPIRLTLPAMSVNLFSVASLKLIDAPDKGLPETESSRVIVSPVSCARRLLKVAPQARAKRNIM